MDLDVTDPIKISVRSGKLSQPVGAHGCNYQGVICEQPLPLSDIRTYLHNVQCERHNIDIHLLNLGNVLLVLRQLLDQLGVSPSFLTTALAMAKPLVMASATMRR